MAIISFESEHPGRTHGRPAIFLDRDGVLVENCDAYTRRPEDVVLLPGAAAAVRRIADLGHVPVIVSNQAVVGRGLITAEQARSVHAHVLDLLAAAGAPAPAASYLCPHAAERGCPCRKPRPGLLHHAARRLGVDLSRSVMVGDALTDVLAAAAAGVPGLLVLTGRGRAQAALPDSARIVGDRVFPSLVEVADHLGAAPDDGSGPAARR
ncbi:D-glycero-alpha-D-manno-heptose-1,7-bisphosphate 7-phosphatase [Longispora urticae]